MAERWWQKEWGLCQRRRMCVCRRMGLRGVCVGGGLRERALRKACVGGKEGGGSRRVNE